MNHLMILKNTCNEIYIGYSLKKFLDLIEDNGFEVIPLSFEHALTVSKLKFIHRDPFDRLIISQAMSDDLTIITKDEYIEKYDVKTMW